ncbi:MAG: MFS transporter [Verrucomicrobiales bacterium]|jgi:MFS family permease|nr:MFS transporter [Verrucomicrobiales bacterium]
MSDGGKTYKVGTLAYTKGGLAVLFLWLLWGDFCFMLMEAVVPSLVPVKFMELKAHNTLVGAFTISVPAAIAFVCNPVISFRSDRYRSRFGRRIPFIVATMPFLVGCLIALGYVNVIGKWIKDIGLGDTVWSWFHALLPSYFQEFSEVTGILVALCFFLTMFSFFNTFVNAVFWYLFNDVVPEILLARFISWFRMVSIGSGALYNLMILKHAETHYTEIFVGAGILYFVGFGLMCLKVKEGQYPPPPEYIHGETGPFAAMKTYASECMTLKHYWFLFLASMALVLAVTVWQFNMFYQRELGFSYDQIGKLQFASNVSSVLIIPLTGWLADKFHPIRVVICGLVLQFVVAPLSMIWVFWQPDIQTVFYVQMGISCLLGAPVGCLIAMMDPPLFMRIFPRERYGQFCSANAMMRAVASVAGGFLLGTYLDHMQGWFGARVAYCSMGLWSVVAYALVLLALLGLYRSWQQHGGDKNYSPPLPK